MPRQEIVFKVPNFAETGVPCAQTPVRFKDANGLKQIVERGGADAQQRIARARQLRLLRPVFQDEEQAAIGQRLTDEPKMLATGEDPCFFHRSADRIEPLPPFGLPRGEVACFRQAVGLAHPVQQPVKIRAFGHPFGLEPKHLLKRLVAEHEPAIIGELGHSSGQTIKRIALCFSKAAERLPRALHLFHVNGVSRNAGIAQGHIHDAQRAALAIDRGGHNARGRLPFGSGSSSSGHRRWPAICIDELQPPLNHVRCTFRLHRADISGVDHGEAQIRATVPHGEGRGFQQTGHRGEGPLYRAGFVRQPGDFGLTLGHVKEPERHRILPGQPPARRQAADHQRPVAAPWHDRPIERPRRALDGRHIFGYRLHIVRRQAEIAKRQV